MPKPIPYKFRLVYFLAFVLAFLVGFPILVFYSAGYSFDETFGLSGLSIRGGIYVSTPEPDTSVFIGNDLEGVSGFFKKEVLTNRLKPGQYLVLVTNDIFWPWAKMATVERGEVEPFFPLFVPKVIEANEVPKTDSSYKKTAALFVPAAPASTSALTATTTATTTRISRRQVKIWLDPARQTVYAQWLGSSDAAPKYFCLENSENVDLAEDCAKPIVVFHSLAPVRTLEFYPLRSDAIILAADNGVYAYEIDNRAYQNFYPIFSGVAPDFRINAEDELFVKDENKIIELDLKL